MEISAFPRDVQVLRVKLTSAQPQFAIDEDDPTERNVIFRKLDELSATEQRAFDALTSGLPLPTADEVRRDELLLWRQNEPRVRRIQRLASHLEISEEDDGFARDESGLSDALRQSIAQHTAVVQVANFGMSSSWDLARGVLLQDYHTLSSDSGSRSVRPCLNLTMLAVRKAPYFTWNIEMPMGVLTLLTAFTFALPPSDTADRLSLTLTLVLTAVAYKLTVAAVIPVVSYVTALDTYVLGCLFFMVLACASSVCVPALAASEEAQIALNRTFGLLWAALCACALGWYVHQVRRMHGQGRKAMGTFAEEKGEWRHAMRSSSSYRPTEQLTA